MSDQIKWLCARCGRNKKAVNTSPSRTSPLRSLCEECEARRQRIRNVSKANKRRFERELRALGRK